MSKKSTGEKPLTKGLQYHIHCKKGDVAPSVLMPGDPWRVPKIAKHWTRKKKIAFHREYQTYTGKIGRVPISCTSSGIGAPALTIALEELVAIGAKTFIRVGTTASIQPKAKIGDLIIPTGAVRLDGASKDYVRVEYPAVAHYRVVNALIQAAEKLKVNYHVGITASTDSFYCGQGRHGFKGYLPSFQEDLMKDLQKANVLNFEMEASCLLTLASIFGVRAGAICVVIVDRVRNKFKITDEMEERAGRVASEAVRILGVGTGG
jgi:uridine phosphorylase